MLAHLARAVAALALEAARHLLLPWLRDRGRGRGGPDGQRRRARAALAFLVRMGPIYIKLGQIAATRSDLLPPEWTDTLRALQDRAPHMPPGPTRRALERELGGRLDEVFRDLDPRPIASASVAQVHVAHLHDGRKVAVKLVKDGVPEEILRSLRALGSLVRAAHLLVPRLRHLDLPHRFDEVARLLLPQADMRREARQQQRVRADFAGHPHVRVPEVVPELVTARVLVMEHVDGIPGRDAHLVDLPRAQLARRLQDAVYTMLYMHGLSHGDPHPGNVLFTPSGELVLLDYGVTAELTEDEKWGLSSFYYACTRKEWALAVDRFTRHFVHVGPDLAARRAGYERRMAEVLRHHFDTSASRWSTVAYFADVNEVLRAHGCRYTTTFTKVELVFLSCEGFAGQIDPDIDIWANARRFTDRYSPYTSAEVEERFAEDFAVRAPTSLRLRERARSTLVAPTHVDRYFFPSAFPVFVREASGGRVRDFDGNEYVDLCGGYGPHLLGYGHPDVVAAVTEGVRRGQVNGVGNLPEVELAELLVDALPGAERAVLCNSGSEAVLLAVRMCRGARGRAKVAKFEGHYHGLTDQGLVSSWFRFAGERDRPEPVAGSHGADPAAVAGTLVLQYGDVPGLERLREHADELACVLLEPMPTSVVALDAPFLVALRRVCDETGVPLVFDEVVSGFRVAYGGVQSVVGVRPDLTCLGKVIGGGLPCGAVVGRAGLVDVARSTRDPFQDYERKVFAGGTLSGNSLSCAAGAAVLRRLRADPDVYARLEAGTDRLAGALREAAGQRGIACRVSARGSIFSLTFSHRPARLYRDRLTGSDFKATIALAYYMRRHGVHLPELHAFLISAAHTAEDLELVAAAFAESLDEMTVDGFFTA
ncbi:aminotransferase [Actinosynnema pretiosum]|uniref:Aminotransferase n=1 Tax=Actinosynnema pretiosum TaxID=42197 RepID=A0A290ZGT1_9PSEU|nr:aminotransferase [Actinosynnema pretiosum]